jgi:hypothetical protein
VDSQAQDIVTWAEQQTTPKSNSPTQRRLSDTDKALALKYQADGVSQVEIAKRLGVTQPAISQWLSKCRDTTEAARLYLAGQSLRMAQNIVRKGLPRDHIQALSGQNVLNQQDTGKTIVFINNLNLAGLGEVSPPAAVVEGETLHND